MRTFKSSPLELLRSFLLSAVIAWCCFALAGACIFALIRNYDLDFSSPEFMGISIASAAVISLLVIFFRARITVEVTDEAVLFYRSGRLYKKYELSSYIIGSYVYRTRIYFIPVSVAKYLTFAGAGKREIKQKCTCFAMSEFENLLSYIRERDIEKALSAQHAAKAYESRQENVSEQNMQAEQPEIRQSPMHESFYIPRDSIISVCRKRNTIVLIILGTLVLIPVIIMASSMFARNPYPDEVQRFGFAVAFMILIMGIVYYLVYMRPLQKLQSSLPSQITVSETFISIDSDTFYYPDIIQIKTTPPGYTNGKNLSSLRKMTVATRNSVIFEYCLGFTSAGKDAVFQEYGLLCRTIEIALVKNGSAFAFEL